MNDRASELTVVQLLSARPSTYFKMFCEITKIFLTTILNRKNNRVATVILKIMELNKPQPYSIVPNIRIIFLLYSALTNREHPPIPLLLISYCYSGYYTLEHFNATRLSDLTFNIQFYTSVLLIYTKTFYD
jgi:hypothetical protein